MQIPASVAEAKARGITLPSLHSPLFHPVPGPTIVQSRRGGGDWETLEIDLESPYLDERPLLTPAQPEMRDYRLQFYEDDAPTGDFTAVAMVTV